MRTIRIATLLSNNQYLDEMETKQEQAQVQPAQLESIETTQPEEQPTERSATVQEDQPNKLLYLQVRHRKHKPNYYGMIL